MSNQKQFGFDNEKYLKEQKKAILERINKFKGKLYLEFGGKIMHDFHAARVLPGYDPDVKIKLLQKLKDKLEIIICIHAGAIEDAKVQADFGITYDYGVFKMIDNFNELGLKVCGVVITRFENQVSAKTFKNKLERKGIKVYLHKFTKGYPSDVNLIVSENGYGKNEYIKTKKALIIVTGPGPGSGKLSTCLSQIYHDFRKGKSSGYAKFETFPIWNLPLNHPVNIAYEAATADLNDYNAIDQYHFKAYKKKAVNYNRDIEAFPLLQKLLEKIYQGKSIYKSPTDMGVNRAGFGIINDESVKQASKQEVIRRYYRYSSEYAHGLIDNTVVERVEELLKKLKIKPTDRKVVIPARKAASEAKIKGKGNKGIFSGGAIELPNGEIVTGKNSILMHASSSLVLNAIKTLANIPDEIHLLPPSVIKSIEEFKNNILGSKALSLDLEETLIALSVSSATNPSAELALKKLKDLGGCEVHLTHIPTPADEAGFRKLRVNLTSDPYFSSSNFLIQ